MTSATTRYQKRVHALHPLHPSLWTVRYVPSYRPFARPALPAWHSRRLACGGSVRSTTTGDRTVQFQTAREDARPPSHLRHPRNPSLSPRIISSASSAKSVALSPPSHPRHPRNPSLSSRPSCPSGASPPPRNPCHSWIHMSRAAPISATASVCGRVQSPSCKSCNPLGSTICYAFKQDVDMVNDYATDCFRHREIKKLKSLSLSLSAPVTSGRSDTSRPTLPAHTKRLIIEATETCLFSETTTCF